MTAQEIRDALNARKDRSAWSKGVTAYALDLLDDLDAAEDIGSTSKEIMPRLLNGAANWDEYSTGGCSYIYDSDIAARLCTPSELKRTNNGDRRPNRREEWLDTQTRALWQAANRIGRIARHHD